MSVQVIKSFMIHVSNLVIIKTNFSNLLKTLLYYTSSIPFEFTMGVNLTFHTSDI